MSLEHDPTPDIRKERLDKRQILILYGSETGNSQDAAGDIGRLAERLRFQTLVYEMNDIELSTLLRYPLVIFVISTTGQGEIPKNARQFWKSLLRKRLPPSCLKNVNFTTFGLGDSSYSKYNWAVRKLHKRLEQLGATEFFSRGEADERHEDGIDTAFLPWSASLRTHLQTKYPLPEGLSPIPLDVPLPPRYTIEMVSGTNPQDVTMSEHTIEMVSGTDPQDVTMSEHDDGIPGDGAEPTGSAATENNFPRENEPNQGQHDNQQHAHDETAALFSHVDTLNPELLQQLHREDRMANYGNSHTARLSEHTAKNIVGNIDILDRPNVLRDHPTKYTLQDSDNPNENAPEDLLPMPNAWHAIVEQNDRVTPPGHWQDVRHLTLRVEPKPSPLGSETPSVLEYAPGDVVVLYPKNFPEDVQALIDLMGWGDVANMPFQHRAKDYNGIHSRPKNCYPLPDSTLRQLLLHNYDITSIPKRGFFEEIAYFTENPEHRERLQEFADPKFSDEFYDYTSRPRRSILEVLQDFPSVRIPYQHIPSLFPVIRGREYSIASGGILQHHPMGQGFTQVELLIALVKYKTVLRKTRQGLCSRYLASVRPGTRINIGLEERGDLILNTSNRPLLAIGPGTGIAPIRSLIWERYKDNQEGVRPDNEMVLFFGGRNRNADYFFEEEWGHLDVEVFTAFSRDQPQKIYVQDRIREQALLVCDLFSKGAIVYLCGSSGRMPEAVRQALYDAMVIGGLVGDLESAKEFFQERVIYREEVW